jgi:hypothetical protein
MCEVLFLFTLAVRNGLPRLCAVKKTIVKTNWQDEPFHQTKFCAMSCLRFTIDFRTGVRGKPWQPTGQQQT